MEEGTWRFSSRLCRFVFRLGELARDVFFVFDLWPFFLVGECEGVFIVELTGLGSLASSLFPPRVTAASLTSQPISHTQYPSTVNALLPPVTTTGLALSVKMAMKHVMNMTTELRCCVMTVLSATNGQKSYGWTLTFRWSWLRKDESTQLSG